ncbi:hypothetical protein C1646_755854 [Rhizophagus diaphanus]|nr:hypothetical protein C1646_755854 [Rhizophagus diaphanus] [Rhizophagus sp. MUCL 43196]
MEGENSWRSHRSFEYSLARELLAIIDIEDYWLEKPPKKNIHALLNKSGHGMYKVLPRNLADEPSLGCCITAFDVIVSPKRTKGFKWTEWTVNIDDATLEGLKEYIREMDKPPALE